MLSVQQVLMRQHKQQREVLSRGAVAAIVVVCLAVGGITAVALYV
jgi:hypothetical protein